MGVRGLTSYVARHAELYLTPYELHDSNLVIDGDNLACNLYKDVSGTYSAFGGDYDSYFRSVVQFFNVVAECNIRSYVLMDGGYEHRKLRTVGKRLRGKISVIKRINPCDSIPVFPLLMKEVFVDAVRHCGVPVMRCVFEADDELAALSRKLNCPVLSYDSDFYIHNVWYIPLVTLTAKVHTKQLNKLQNQEQRLHKNKARSLEKRTKANVILNGIHTDDERKQKMGNSSGTFKYLDCCIYRVENFIARGSLSKEKLPLFAALLGNDYIARSAFRNFFTVGMGKAGRSKKMKQQQRRIRLILQWLRNETAESALNKILSRLKKNQREALVAQVRSATSGYLNEKCHSYEYFKKYHQVEADPKLELDDIDISEDSSAQISEVSEVSSVESDEDEEAVDVDECEIEDEDESVGEGEDSEENPENEEHNEDEVYSYNSEERVDNAHPEEACSSELSMASVASCQASEGFKKITDILPQWILEKLFAANVPRFIVDLVHLKKYINNPQIEHFPYNDCHEIALPILIYIFTLLNFAQDISKEENAQSDIASTTLEFTYLTRATRITNIRYCRYSVEAAPSHPFHPNNPNPLLFREVFENKMHDLDVELLFNKVNLLPEDLRLYFLSIIFWLRKSQHFDLNHLYALIICLVVLRTVDAKIPPERDLILFQKRFGKIIRKERLIRETDSLRGVKRKLREDIEKLSIPDRMSFVPKSDCYLVQENLLKHFHMKEIFKKKYDLFSTIVLHGFAEFQSVAFQLHSLNALLDFPFDSFQMGQLYCGVFLYNIYDLLRLRIDVHYYVQNFIFQDSPMMYDFYSYLVDWCHQFIPKIKGENIEVSKKTLSKKILKKQRQAARKQSMVNIETTVLVNDHNLDDTDNEFYDINNKFCSFLKIVN